MKVCTTDSGEDIFIDFDKKLIDSICKKLEQNGRKFSVQDALNPNSYIQKPIMEKLPQEAFSFLFKLSQKQPEQFKLVYSVLNKTSLRTKTHKGVSDEYITSYVKKLAMSHPILLKNIVDNKIPIMIHDDMLAFSNKVGHAQFGVIWKTDNTPFSQCLHLSERIANGPITVNGVPLNTIESLPHELAHAFDYNNGRKLNLTRQEENPLRSECNKYLDMPSFSKEFSKAITMDMIRMAEIDEKNELERGTTFKTLLSDVDFAYYLGAHKSKIGNLDISFDDISAKKEMFAQLFSYATGARLTSEYFQEKVEELFPNGLAFAKQLVEEAEKL